MDKNELAEHPEHASHVHDVMSSDQEPSCERDQSDGLQESGDPHRSDGLQESSEAKRGDDEDAAMDHSNLDYTGPR